MLQLRSELIATAIVRRAQAAGAFAAVTARGDPDAGVILVKVNLLDGRAIAHAPELDFDTGESRWTTPMGADPKPEAEVDAYLTRRCDRDPDAWVIEIEDRQGRAFID